MPDEQYAAPNSADLSKIKKEKAIQHVTPYTNPDANPLAKYENYQSAADSSTKALNPIELQSLSQNPNMNSINNQHGYSQTADANMNQIIA